MEAFSVARFTRASFTPSAWARAFSILATQLAQCMPEIERSSFLSGSFPTNGFFSSVKNLENLKLIYKLSDSCLLRRPNYGRTAVPAVRSFHPSGQARRLSYWFCNENRSIYIMPKFTRRLLKKNKKRSELPKKSFHVRRNHKDA